jgi:hypothetical protein
MNACEPAYRDYFCRVEPYSKLIKHFTVEKCGKPWWNLQLMLERESKDDFSCREMRKTRVEPSPSITEEPESKGDFCSGEMRKTSVEPSTHVGT